MVGTGSYDELQRSHRGWIEDYLGNGEKSRHDEWSKSIAVGSRSFVETVKHFLGIRAKGRDVVEGGQGYQLREAEHAETKADFRHKMSIAQKEINETLYWLELLKETEYLTSEQFESINQDAVEIIKLITSIIKSVKKNA